MFNTFHRLVSFGMTGEKWMCSILFAFHSSCLLECRVFITAEIVHWLLIYYCKKPSSEKVASRFSPVSMTSFIKDVFFSHSHFLLCPLEHSNTDHHWFRPPDFIWTSDTGLYRSFLSCWSICASFVGFQTEPPAFPSSSFNLRATGRHWSLSVCVWNACNASLHGRIS